jgi:hypothetical protein
MRPRLQCVRTTGATSDIDAGGGAFSDPRARQSGYVGGKYLGFGACETVLLEALANLSKWKCGGAAALIVMGIQIHITWGFRVRTKSAFVDRDSKVKYSRFNSILFPREQRMIK